MYVKQIELRNFRNYEYGKVEFHEKVNIFTGENGNGKTNLAEALYLMCLAKSFRTPKDKEMIRFGQETAYVQTIIDKDDRHFKTEIKVLPKAKEVKINGVKRKRVELPQYINIVIFSPEDLKMIKEEPDKRRRFINRELCQMKPIYYETLYRYMKVLNQRNVLLKEEKINPLMMEVWDDEFIFYGTKIIQQRDEFIKKLNQISAKIHANITAGKEELKLDYESNIPLADSLEEQQEIFKVKLKETFYQDKMRGFTGSGPHKDDLKMTINEIDVRHFGSQGQQRTTALSLKLAEIEMIKKERGETPILILDDVLSELDQKRQDFLINSLFGIQLFLTTTELNEKLIQKLPEHNLYKVEDGVITLIGENT